MDTESTDLTGAANRLRYLWTDELDPLFWPASRAGIESAWATHIPFAHWLVATHRPRCIVELGTHRGISYSAFCEAVLQSKLDCRCFAVDTWQGDDHAGHYGLDVYEDLQQFHDCRYASFSELIRLTFDTALDYIPDQSIDLLHIDGFHTYDAVSNDFNKWKLKLSNRAVVLFHDTNVRERNFGVWQLWHELAREYPSFEFLHGHGLGLLVVGQSCIGPARDLSRLSAAATNTVRQRFSFLGERWQHEMRGLTNRSALQKLRSDQDILSTELRQQQAAAQELAAELSRISAKAAADEAAANHRNETLAKSLNAEQEKVRLLERAVHEAKDQSNALQISLGQANFRINELDRLLKEAGNELQHRQDRLAVTRAALSSIETSTAWRISWPARRIGARMPQSVRCGIRGIASVIWWTATFKLLKKMRGRRTVIRVEKSPRSGAADSDVKVEPSCRLEPVHIVICVHNALESVQECIDSLLRCTLPPYRIIVIDDGSDLATASYLAKVAREQNFMLHRNPEAIGYTRAANIGLRLATAPWIVLLNSDTVVVPKWVDRMWAHGARDPSIGLIGPLSNTASWQSVPQVFAGDDWAANPRPSDLSIEEMGDLVAAQGIGAVPLPFVNGFCLMIRHDVIQSVGLFDEITFAKGYGEENDYCIRVRNAGWSLVVATDVYIHHAQSKSYSNDRRLRLVNQADEALMRKHDATRDIWPQAGLCRDSLALASSRARIAGALRREDLLQQGRHRFEGKRVGIILPIGERGGGANVILQESLSLVAMGVDVTLFNLDRSNELLGPLPESRILQIRTFASHEALTLHLTNEQRRYDALIATLYCSVYWLPQHSTCRLAYYIQDFEPYFFAIDDPDRSLAMNSYRHGESVRLVTKTRWNQKEVGRHCGRHPLILGPSVDVSAFAPCPFRIGGGPIVVVAMVRPSTPRRAPERTLAVLEKVKARLADRVSVTIFGSLDSELVAAGLVRSWATNAGPLDKARLASLLASADIFLDCSDYQAMGLTALEAMLSGCAVVGPQRGGMNDFVRTGVNGVLADTQDIEACAQALINLVNNDEMRKQISLQAVADANLYIPEQSALNLMRALFDA